MSLIAVLQEGFFSRGLLAGVFGLTIGLIGVSDLGVFRGTFGSVYLFDGVPAIPALIGMFAASEFFNLTSDKYLIVDEQKRKMNFSRYFWDEKSSDLSSGHSSRWSHWYYYRRYLRSWLF